MFLRSVASKTVEVGFLPGQFAWVLRHAWFEHGLSVIRLSFVKVIAMLGMHAAAVYSLAKDVARLKCLLHSCCGLWLWLWLWFQRCLNNESDLRCGIPPSQ